MLDEKEITNYEQKVHETLIENLIKILDKREWKRDDNVLYNRARNIRIELHDSVVHVSINSNRVKINNKKFITLIKNKVENLIEQERLEKRLNEIKSLEQSLIWLNFTVEIPDDVRVPDIIQFLEQNNITEYEIDYDQIAFKNEDDYAKYIMRFE